MTAEPLSIVAAEGPSTRQGLLRYVLENEGYEVAGEAADSASLAQAVAAHRPDVVVMDDGIGVTAVAMVREMAPDAKLVLVWPSAVVPIGGDARVDPSEVVRELGPTIERLTGVPSATGMLRADSGEDAVPAGEAALGLGAILALGRIDETDHPLQPVGAAGEAGEPIIDDRSATPLLILPGAAALAGVEAAAAPAAAAATAPQAVAGSAVAATVVPLTSWTRRLGTLALGGAAVAGSLILGVSLSGSRVPIHVAGEGPVPSVAATPASGPSSGPTPPPGSHTGATPPGSLLGAHTLGQSTGHQPANRTGQGTDGSGGGGGTGGAGGGGGGGGNGGTGGSGGGTGGLSGGSGGGTGGLSGGGGGGSGGSTGGGGGGKGGASGGGGRGSKGDHSGRRHHHHDRGQSHDANGHDARPSHHHHHHHGEDGHGHSGGHDPGTGGHR